MKLSDNWQNEWEVEDYEAGEHSIAKKLSDNWQNEWEVEDYEAGDC